MDTSWIKNIIEKIKITFDFKRINSPLLKLDNRIQIGQANIQQGLTYSEAKDLIELVVDPKLSALKDEAEATYNGRVNEFKNLFTEKTKNLLAEEIAKLREPDTQLALIEAAKISGRKQNEELRNLLANLVVSRIKNDKTGKEELKNIVYNEAISTINKLTIDQLKIATLCYLLRYSWHTDVDSWEAFDNCLNTRIKPFLGFKNTNAEFQHIEYAGCGSMDSFGWDVIDIFRRYYSFLFFNLLEKEQIDNLNLSDEVKKTVVVLDTKEDKYSIRFKNRKKLEEYLEKKKVEEQTKKKLYSIYEGHIRSKDDIKAKILRETKIGKELMEIWEKSALKHLSLTSVGIAIAASYFEQTTGEKINIDIWIN